MLNLFKTLIIVNLLIFQATANAASNENKIDDLAHAFMKNSNVTGLSIAIINKDKTSIFNYGYADELKKIPTTNDTIYTIASFSKTFTATLAAVAGVEGKLNLDNSFNQYIPGLKNNKYLTEITTSMLLGHVSSLPFNFTPSPTTYREGIADLNQFIPTYPPGSRFKYSNAGIGIVGYELQNIYGKDYATILADKITKPLGMHSTYLNLPIDKAQYVALGHDDNGIRQYDSNIDVWFATASLKSTIADMAKYLNAQINYTALNNSTLSRAITIVHQNKYCFANKRDCEQLSWQAHIMSALNSSDDDTFYSIDKNGNINFGTHKIISNPYFPKNYFIDKTGSGYGMSSYMAYIPDKKVGIVILLNRSFFINKEEGNQRIKLGRDILKSLTERKI